jgi:photosystem II stability/assembly factor-like uncharacterized protein
VEDIMPHPAREREKDDAARRRQAELDWYGGESMPEYRQFLLQAAAVERTHHAHLMPLAPDSPLRGQPAAGNTWINIGPADADFEVNGNVKVNERDSGRPVSIIPDPTNAASLYLATAGGGVWRTMDGGTSWTPLTETLGSLACGFLAMDPHSNTTLYLGLGDAFDGTGIGLVKSTDGGNSWSPPVFLGSATVINQILVSPVTSGLLLVTTNVGLFRSTDAGATWSPVSISTGAGALPYGWNLAWAGGSSVVLTLEADRSDPAGSGQIHYSLDDGATWHQASGVVKAGGLTRFSLASAPSNRQILYAMGSNPGNDLADLFKSTDGGHTWTALHADTKTYTNPNAESAAVKELLGGQGFYNQAVLVDPADPAIAYFGGELLLAKTTDGGQTFTQTTNWLKQFNLPYVHADFHCLACDGTGTLYVGTDGGLFKSTDGGTTWTSRLNIGVISHLVYSVGSSLNDPNAVIGGLQDNGTRVRVGATSKFNQTIGGDGFGAHIHPQNAHLMLGTLYYSRVLKSTNGGSTFASASNGITESNNPTTGVFTTRIVPGGADPSGNTVYTFSHLRVYKSTDYAQSWSALGTHGLPSTAFTIRNVGAARSNGAVVGLVANAGRVFLTKNSGTLWTLAAPLPNSGGALSSIWFDSTNSNTIYVASVVADSSKSHLWKSVNFGSSWTSIDTTGFPFGIGVNTIINDPGDAQTLYAGTQLGLYRSSDGGTTWSRHGTGLPLVNVMDVYVAPNSSLVRVATFGRGFWELV